MGKKTADPPFYSDIGDDDLFGIIMAGDFEFHSPFWDPVSEEAKDLIKKMLTVDPGQRPSAQELLHSHPWFKLELEGGVHLGETAEALKRWNARRRFKSTGAAIIAANRLKAIFKAKGNKATESNAEHCEATQSTAKRSKAELNRAKQRKVKQSKRSDANRHRAKRSKA